MNKSAARRWAVLLGVLATVVALSLPARENEDSMPQPQVRHKPVAVPIPIREETLELSDAETESSEIVDPFAPRGWQAQPIAAAAAPMVASAPAPQAPTPIAAPGGPPPLPYKFMGQMDDAGRTVVYLSRGEQIMVARPGETLEGVYKVLAIDSGQIELEHLPTGAKQAISLHE